MTDDGQLGQRLRRLRRENAMTQEQLAHRSGLSAEMIAKTEQGHRQPRLPVLARLASALDVPLSEMLDNRPRLGARSESTSILAIRDVLLSPSQLPGGDADAGGEPAAVASLEESLADAARLYWAGDFAALAAVLPALIGECRLAARAGAEQPAASSVLAQAYDLAASLMVHMGKEDLAAVGAERAISAALGSEDELLHATLQGTYAWVLLHQGRMSEAEQLAAAVADRIEPAFSAPDAHVAAWGNLLMLALAPAAAAGNDIAPYIQLAGAGAERLGRRVNIYQTSFAPATVQMQACHAYAVTREPAMALAAASRVHAEDLDHIAYGRHLLDVSQAHADARRPAEAVTALARARDLGPVWFRHQGIARALVSDLVEQNKRLSPALRELAEAVDPDWYAPYHRPSE
jgi:transcriptional regulator with XRE-family HTH domain